MSSIDHATDATDDPGYVRASELDELLTRGDRVRYHGRRYDDGLLATVVAGPESKLTNVSEALIKFDVHPNAVGVAHGVLERIDDDEEEETEENETLTVRDLARRDTGLGTAPNTDKVNFVWEVACENLDLPVGEFIDELGQYVSESYAREVLQEMPPEAFGLSASKDNSEDN